MPLTETEWGLVASWARDHLLDAPEPRDRLLRAGLPADFVEDLPLTPDPGRNALLVVAAARRDIAHQRRLLSVLAGLDALAAIDDPRGFEQGAEARNLLTRLREDERLRRSPRDPFHSTLLKHGTEVFLDRSELREKLRGFLADPEQTVFVVDGPEDSGRSYTYELIRHLGQHCDFHPVRVTLSRTSTAARLLERLSAFVAGPEGDRVPLDPTRLNDPLPCFEDAAHRIVARATAAEDRFWLVLDDCDRLDPHSDVWDCIGVLARAIYEHTPVRAETVPRLVLLGYAKTMRQLPYEIRKNECRDTSRPADENDLRSFFREFFTDTVPAGQEETVRALTETAVAEVLRAVESSSTEDGRMRRLCTAVEEVVRLHRALPPTSPPPGEAGHVLRDALRTGLAAPAAALPGLRRAYREAACLLREFDPARLRLADEEQATGRAVLELVDDCTALPAPVGCLVDQAGSGSGVRCLGYPQDRGDGSQGGGGSHGGAMPADDDAARRGARRREPGPIDQTPPGTTVWTLKPEIRDAALAGLAGPGAALRALRANIGLRPEGPGPERTALALLTGAGLPPTGTEPADPGAGSHDEVEALSDALQATLWLSRVPGVTGLPEVDEVQHRLERARLLQPMRRLVRGTFHDRTAELDALHAYLALPEEPAEPPVLLHGVGGIGKSTLLAKFLVDALAAAGPAGFPFAHIDFARPTLSVHEPATVIAEMARQLGVHHPAHRAAFEELADECERTAALQRGERNELDELHRLAGTRATLGRDYSSDFHARASAREQELAHRVASLVAEAVRPAPGEAPPPLVVVVDSFEEAQYRGSPVIARMWAVWTALRAAYSRLRFIVSGRAPIDHPARVLTPRTMELTELDHEASVDLLMSSGVTDEPLAEDLVDRIGGHPLSLKLAARTAVALGADSPSLGELLRRLPSRRRHFDRQVDQMLIQGTLYDRLLKHIAEDDVRVLVQAGLALRFITPDLVREVLAKPAGLVVESAGEARRLYGLLTSRADLMESAGPGAIRHRTDLRAIMLRLSDSARTDLMRAVDRRAVAYYAAREGPRERAEEIYHRLRLGENPRTVEARWEPGVAPYLGGSAYREMARRSAAFLLGRIGGHVPDQIMTEADQEDWERIAAREVEDLLTQGYVEAAGQRLSERRPWTPCSRLHALLAETLARSGRTAQAREGAERAVDRAEEAGCAETQLELLQLSARLAQDSGDFAEADRDLQEAEEIAAGLGLRHESLGVLVARSRLAELADVDAAPAEERLARTLRGMPDADLARQPSLARTAAAAAYRADPRLLEHTLRLVGLPADEEAVVTELARWIDATLTDEPGLRGPLTRILESAAGAETFLDEDRPDLEGIERALREARGRGTLDSVARQALALRDGSGALLLGVASAMGAGPPRPQPSPLPPPPGADVDGHGAGRGPGPRFRLGDTGPRPDREAIGQSPRPDREATGQSPRPDQGATGRWSRPLQGAPGRWARPRRGGAGLWTRPPPNAAGAALRKVPFLPQAQLVRVRNAALEAGLADRALRPTLLKGIPGYFTATLEPLEDPREQAHADLDAMNQVERLLDGLVPLEIWLHNAIEQTHEPGPRAVLQGALDAVARAITGEAELPAEMMPGEMKEEIVLQDDTVPYGFLHGGIRAGASVALLRIPPYESGAPLLPSYPHGGTGWMIAPGLLITNHHVVMARSWESGVRPYVSDEDLRLQALMSRSRFDFVEDAASAPEATAGELAAWDAALDYAIVRLSAGQEERPTLRIATRPLLVRERQRVPVNIIQHPGGLPKRVALRNNLVYRADEHDILYFTDTRGGSSGSPVCLDDWTVVGLHRGTRKVDEVEFQGARTRFVNVGTQMSGILTHLRESRPELYGEIMAAQSGRPVRGEANAKPR
ncbi:trypsin-like peptidase domain-containing protein [Streptomyces sp. TLI_105]|uniref:trypsin-like peptidase domain-containing protein n=1 Tax=Streptomyces sp. TLI_105 TaxID=1881019 RepID=UPI00089B6361|nr:trypsin-like peptidase domain-containing protein [Streptomyces sp. TLI_105]SEB98562.1 AAA ATPase domain-containing protein [Streptomyces sp. TLI_105]